MEPKKQIDIIRELCDEKGLKIYAVFKRAGVPDNTIGNWKIKEPDAFTVVHKVHAAIKEMEAEKLLAEAEQL